MTTLITAAKETIKHDDERILHAPNNSLCHVLFLMRFNDERRKFKSHNVSESEVYQ